MKNILFISILILFCTSCDNGAELGQKTLDLQSFTMTVPSTWTAINQQGKDSYVGQIKMNDKETLTFDLGWYSDELNVDGSLHDITITTIDEKRAKIVKPKNLGQGTTGVYFDSLETTKTNKFQMSGINLNAENQELLLTAIETLKFKN